MLDGVGAGRLTGAAVLGLAVPVTLAQSLVPLLSQAIGPGTVATIVPVALIGAGLLMFVSRRHLIAGCCGAAALIWSLVGLAPLLPATWEVPVLRLGAFPLALVAMAVVLLPSGGLFSTRSRALVTLALLTATLAGAGVGLPTLAILGALVIASAVRPGRPGLATVVQAGVGLSLVGLEALSSEANVPTWLSFDAVGLVIVVAALATVVASDRGLSNAVRAPATDNATELAHRLGIAMGSGPVPVAFATDQGFVDLDGAAATPAPEGLRVLDRRRQLLAVVGTRPGSATGLRTALVDVLEGAGRLAVRRHELRRQSQAVEQSRRRLVAAGVEERARVQLQLQRRVLDRLDGLGALLTDELLLDRLESTRAELARLGAGIDPLQGRGLAAALAAIAERSDRVDAVITLAGEPDPLIASTAWYVASDAVTNALKHARGSRVELMAGTTDGHLVITVIDHGPGGVAPGGPVSITDRVRATGGRTTVHSGPDGTSIEVVLPFAGLPVPGPRALPDPATTPRVGVWTA